MRGLLVLSRLGRRRVAHYQIHGCASLLDGVCDRFFSSPSSPPTQNNDDNKTNEALPVASNLVDASLRGTGQVIFLNSRNSGMILLGGLFLGDPYLSVLAATGAATATTVAHASGLDKAALKDGLWGYNGCLVGCATAVFVSPLAASPGIMKAATAGLATTLIGSAATPFVAAALKPALGSVPQFTLAFNIVTLSMLLRTRPLLPPPTETTTTTIDTTTNATEAVSSIATETAPGLINVALNAPLKGISQIFVVESNLAGAALVSGIAYYSPGLAAHAVAGSTIGTVTGLLLGADMSSLAIGLWGFNSALTSLGVGVFFVHSPQAMALSAGGAAATAAVFGAMSTVFGAYGSPCLTLPFCLTMSGCYLLGTGIVPGLKLAQAPHSPEKNN